MKRRTLLSAAVGVLVMSIAIEALPCGDKLLVVGRGARFQRGYVAVYPASVLVVEANRAVADGLLASLRRAGHRAEVVQNPAEVRGAVARNTYEIVLGDWRRASEIQLLVSSVAPSALFLPTLDGASKDEVAEATKLYRCALQSDKKQRNRTFLAGLDDAIGAKRKSKPIKCELK